MSEAQIAYPASLDLIDGDQVVRFRNGWQLDVTEAAKREILQREKLRRELAEARKQLREALERAEAAEKALGTFHRAMVEA